MAFVSYARNFEDVLLNRVFGAQQTGFYIDIGASHPVEGSVTKAFYDRGWSGINVETGSVSGTLAASRPRDVTLPGTVPDTGLEGIVATHARGRSVDFIMVRADGTEEVLFRSIDWRRLRPRVLVAEAVLPGSNVLANTAWETILLAGGYVRVYFDGINCFYLPEEDVPALGRHFLVPVNVLDDASVYDPALAEAQAVIETLRQEIAALRPAPPVPVPGPVTTAPPPRPGLKRRLAKAAYALLRPIVRPIAWRLRSFGTGPLLAELRQMREAQDAAATDLNANIVRLLQNQGVEAAQGLAPDSPGQAELRRLAEEMERALLTLAMGTAPQPGRSTLL